MIRPSRRWMIALSLVGLAGAWAASVGATTSAGGPAPAPRLAVYVGTYTGGSSRGIYRFEVDSATGAAGGPVLAGESDDPSFLALHPDGRVLYAVNEVSTFGGAPTGSVSAYAIHPGTGALEP